MQCFRIGFHLRPRILLPESASFPERRDRTRMPGSEGIERIPRDSRRKDLPNGAEHHDNPVTMSCSCHVSPPCSYCESRCDCVSCRKQYEYEEGDGGVCEECARFVPFTPFTDYEKKYYDVRRIKRRDASGNVLEYEIVPHCWPNAGWLMELEGSQRSWNDRSGVEFRLSATHPLG